MSIILINIHELSAQETATTTGGETFGSGGNSSYTIGQIYYMTNIGVNGMVAKGAQQPFEISVLNGIESTENISIQLSTYPNPTADFLTLSIEIQYTSGLSFNLFDITGKKHKKRTYFQYQNSN